MSSDRLSGLMKKRDNAKAEWLWWNGKLGTGATVEAERDIQLNERAAYKRLTALEDILMFAFRRRAERLRK